MGQDLSSDLRPVSGVMCLARTSKAASRISSQFRLGNVSKKYYAVVDGTVTGHNELEGKLCRQDGRQHVEHVGKHADGKYARLKVCDSFCRSTLTLLLYCSGHLLLAHRVGPGHSRHCHCWKYHRSQAASIRSVHSSVTWAIQLLATLST